MTFEIEKDVPLPLSGSPALYPFAGLNEVGWSFLVPVSPGRAPEKTRSRITGAAHQFRKSLPADQRDAWRFVTAFERAKEDASIIVGVRCWRAPGGHRRTFPQAKASAPLASAMGQPRAAPASEAPAKSPNVRRTMPRVESARASAPAPIEIPSFLPKGEGKARVVKGSRY